MVRKYLIKWYPKKQGESTSRQTWVYISNPTGQVSNDAQRALNIFIVSCGNLRKNEIVYIKEFDENGQIGEDIVPSAEGNAIVPTRR